ncbi:MAG: hypothetical protein COT74_10765 [Bdellovibrionales bacterium CG10_big_fil_rev_8_21_14_0_10_45_34]|nr:MAG: hypothetical protein COT74_10765 [Bdellovibrionales bacterium CG10_big_fil_rev_8_21_14_0_10_45_34]
MKNIFTALAIASISASNAVSFENFGASKSRPDERFADGEANFKLAMEKLLQEYMDQGISKEELYRGATAGMLATLNAGDNSWNTLLTPRDVKEIQSDLSGQVSGIGVALKFDETTGHAQIINVIPNSPSEKSGLKQDDQILSVDGKRYKGKQFRDIVGAIRGKVGESISLKVLREDKVISMRVKRQAIPWTPVELSKIDRSTQLLTIGYFTNETPRLVERNMAAINSDETKNLIIDLRDNSGGDFEKAVQTAELFVPKGKVIVGTKGRQGKVQTISSKRGLLKPGVNIVLLTDYGTSSGAELFAGALREGLSAKIVGQGTFGKWNVQTIQTLSNGFAIKYSVMSFQTPDGKTYQDTGLKPDVEVAMPAGTEAKQLQSKYDIPKRLELDPQLKAATELVRAM